jgi:hypothetical protein
LKGIWQWINVAKLSNFVHILNLFLSRRPSGRPIFNKGGNRMEENDRIQVLDEGVDEELEELAACCKPSAPTKFQTAK